MDTPASTSNTASGMWGAMLLNADFVIAQLNPVAAELLGLSAEQSTGQSLLTLLGGLSTEQAQQALQNKQPLRLNAQRQLCADTATAAIHLQLHKAESNNGKVLAMLIPAADSSALSPALLELLTNTISKNFTLESRLANTNQQLLQSEKMAGIGQLAAGVAHEINNPLGFVFSNLQSLGGYIESLFKLIDIALEQSNNPALQQAAEELEYDYIRDDLKSLMDESNEGLQRVKKIIVSLKDFSHIEEEAFAPADLHKGIETTLNVAQNEIKYKANIIREYGELPLVECIASQINQVVMNICVNAAHAIAEFGTIHIRTGQTDDKVWIEIEDNGSGIPEHVKQRIFEPFFTTKPIGKGTGLGLSLSHTIIEKHQGKLEVDSTPNVGTRFKIWLPIQQSNLPPTHVT